MRGGLRASSGLVPRSSAPLRVDSSGQATPSSPLDGAIGWSTPVGRVQFDPDDERGAHPRRPSRTSFNKQAGHATVPAPMIGSTGAKR